MKTKSTMFLLILLGALSLSLLQSADAATSVSESRFAGLKKGVNISNWAMGFNEEFNYTDINYVSDEELTNLKSWGITAIRLPIVPTHIFNSDDGSVLNLTYYDAIINKLIDAGFTVTLDIHEMFGGGSGHSEIRDNATKRENFKIFWRNLADHYKSWDADKLFYEIMNEPNGWDDTTWWNYQGEVLSEIREVDTTHTVIVGANGNDSMWTLTQMTPYDDTNVVYKFHYYSPAAFTCQGCTFWEPFGDLRNVPYPSTPENISQAQVLNNNTAAQQELTNYGNERWNLEKIRNDVESAADWATQHDVRIVVNEFGVLKDYAPEEDRRTWLHDARKVFEDYGFAWAVWAYEGGGFSILDDKDNRNSREPDYETNCALGLVSPGCTPEPTNTPTSTSVPTNTPQPGELSTVRIESGSSDSYTDSAGNVWSADTGATGGGKADRGSIAIGNTSDPRIYQTERWGVTRYDIPVYNGDYTVKLHFAETYTGITGSGQRVFDVNVEGVTIDDLDVYAEAGGRDIALVKTVDITVSDGEVDITFTAQTDSAMISGIEVLPRGGSTPTPTPTTSTPTSTPTSTATPTTSPPTATPSSGTSNLALNKTTNQSHACDSDTTAAKAVNGSISGGLNDKWCAKGGEPYWMQVDLGATYTLSSFTIRHANAAGEGTWSNTRAFQIEVSTDNTNWTTVVTVNDNEQDVSTHTIPATSARYVKLTVTQGERWSTTGLARIYEFEVYGN